MKEQLKPFMAGFSFDGLSFFTVDKFTKVLDLPV
jgi:hypothetical protein